jgi:hypothetical protein
LLFQILSKFVEEIIARWWKESVYHPNMMKQINIYIQWIIKFKQICRAILVDTPNNPHLTYLYGYTLATARRRPTILWTLFVGLLPDIVVRHCTDFCNWHGYKTSALLGKDKVWWRGRINNMTCADLCDCVCSGLCAGIFYVLPLLILFVCPFRSFCITWGRLHRLFLYKRKRVGRISACSLYEVGKRTSSRAVFEISPTRIRPRGSNGLIQRQFCICILLFYGVCNVNTHALAGGLESAERYLIFRYISSIHTIPMHVRRW